MSTSIAQNIEALCQEQGIDRELVVEAIKEAVRAAAKKQFKGGEDIQVAAAKPAAAPAPESLSAIARLMAERTTQSWTTVPHFFLARDIDDRTR